MSGGRKRILCPFTVRKKSKSLEYDKRKIYAGKKKRKFSWNNSWSYYNHEGWFEKFLNGKGAFYNGSSSADSDNDDEDYNKNNEQQQLS